MKDVTFEEVLQELMLEGAEPDYSTLLKYQEKYPKWRDSLAEHFALWAMQSEPIDDEPEISDMEIEEIVREGVAYAMNLLREQGRIIPKDKVVEVSAFEQSVLVAAYVLPNGDASDLADKITEMTGTEASLGATLMALSRLEEKGLVENWKSGKGNRKHFNITIAGERALAYAKETSRVVAGLLGGIA